MAEEFYRQCTLTKGTKQTVSWIPEKFAQKTRPVRLKKDNGAWEDGWVVTAVGAREPASTVHKLEDQHRRQRGQSDI